jgi:glutathione S-transferase
MPASYRIIGSLGSPYSMKMRAIFRYRRLAHVFDFRDDASKAETAGVRPQIVPMVCYPDSGEWHVDSTTIALELESRHPQERSILPTQEADAFLCHLLEDFADEWVTKAMFHYRWYYAIDADYASGWIAADTLPATRHDAAARRAFAREFGDRQIGRMPLVGCTQANRPVIERSYERLLDVLALDAARGSYLFGSRPSLADFGLFGQLKTLADDPTGQQIMRQRAPSVNHWIRQIDDLSGLEGEWASETGRMLRNTLALCCDYYLPFLVANSSALAAGDETLQVSFDEGDYEQAPFRYQAKCHSRLKSLYAALGGQAQGEVDLLLGEGARCLV